jgi:hypothetical protein
MIRRFATAVACAIFAPIFMMLCLFTLANVANMHNDAGSALVMAGFFYGVPLFAVIGFVFGFTGCGKDG